MAKRNLYFEIAAQHSAELRLIELMSTEDAASVNFNGRSFPARGMIIVRRPDSLYRLRIFLHECAHCKLHRNLYPGTPYHQLELDAERYAFAALKTAGLDSWRLSVRSQDYIFGELNADLRAGFKPAPGVFEYIGFTPEEAERHLAKMRSLPKTTAFLRK